MIQGDSGSGLFVKLGSIYYLKGIVSSSLFDEHGDCDVKNYAVFTHIPLYLKWIDNPNDPASLVETAVQVTQPPNEISNQRLCGVMGESLSLIQGGKQSPSESFPWTVAIFVKEDFDLYEHKAVGTLISQKHVVSLANPISYLSDTKRILPIDIDRLKMYFGINTLSQSSASGGLVIDGAFKIILHPNFKHEIPRSADVALIFLQSPVFITRLIAPACLWTLRNDFKDIVGKIGFAVGYGINEVGEYSPYKKHAALRIQDQKVCKQFYENYLDSDKFFCAMMAGATPCEFDDPLYMKVNGRWFLRGLINVYFFRSDDNKCSSSSPVLYEDIARFTNWIQRLLK